MKTTSPGARPLACATLALAIALAAGAANAQQSPAGPGYAEADQAYKAIDRADFPSAVAHAKAAVAAEPGNRDYRRLLISALSQAGRNDEAEAAAATAEAQLGQDAQIAAQLGYGALQQGRTTAAMDHFSKALALGGLDAAQSRSVRLALADAALTAKQPQQALTALAPLSAERSFDVQSRRAFAYAALDQDSEAAGAYAAALELAAQPADQALMARGQIYSLVKLKRIPEAREAFLAADRRGLLAAASPGDAAMLGLAVGEDRRALELFKLAADRGELTPDMALNAGYAAQRQERNRAAADYFRTALDAAEAGKLELSPATTFQVRRAVADMTKRWGATVSAFYGQNGVSSATLAPGARNIAQVGFEGYVRPSLDGWASRVQFFVRAFETVDAGNSQVDTGWKTAQAWVGVAAKPIRSQNLVLEASRMVKLGDLAHNDWMLRAAYSAGEGQDLRPGKTAWPMWQLYSEAARIVDLHETLAYADFKVGRTFSPPRAAGLLVSPFLGATYAYDNKLMRENTFSGGPGVMLRQWFRQTRYKAPQSYVDVILQYRFRLAGDDRSEGVFATLAYNF
jgi:hypothetical protein